ncbi:hypothetical protein [uncultured Tessaracoccus sp.]|uniref:hypothetical protein n=1 Tax=uncultured Tessaracoccus sp. TaxID=905023 RepID=UPI0026215AA2|nr:hypothetical protein [uncultured Tessaracoccus sp.]
MLKKIVSGAAAVAIAAGLSVAAITPAHALTSDMANKLCAVNEAGKATIDCKIVAADYTVQEGAKVELTVKGAVGSDVSFAMFVATDKGLEKVSDDQAVTLPAEPAYPGATDVSQKMVFQVPALKDHFGGKFVITLADTPADAKLVQQLTQQVTVRSANARISGHLAPMGNNPQWRFDTSDGIKGHEFKIQANVDGKWIDFPAAKNDGAHATDDDGYSRFYALSPKVKNGTYPARLFNITTGKPGPEQGTFYIGVEKDDNAGDKGGNKGGDNDRDQGGNKGGKPGKAGSKKPSLPSTGV